jgi:RHS repeat-associated protein
MVSLTRNGSTTIHTYATGTNKVTGLDNGKSYSYDLNGNITASSDKASNGIGYDPYTQMTTSIRPSATEEVRFNYDAANERVLKRHTTASGTSATLYLRGLSEYPLVDRVDNDSAAYERIYIYGATGLLAIRENNSETYIIRDHLGSTRLAVSQDGSAGFAYSYDALGKTIADGRWGASEQLSWARYFYTGQELDTETGLQNFRARFYDDDLFRFYAMDPAGQFASPYSFSGNSPLVFVDRNGKEAITLSALAIAAAWGAGIGAAGYTASVAFSQGGFNNWRWSGFAKVVGMGAVSGMASAGIGSAFGAVGSNGIIGEAARAYAHGASNVGINAAFGNGVNFSNFASGAAGSLMGSGITAAGGGDLAQIAGSSLVGGTTAAATGGNFWRGAASSLTVGLLNHAAHQMGQEEPKPKTMSEFMKRFIGYKQSQVLNLSNTRTNQMMSPQALMPDGFSYLQDPLFDGAVIDMKHFFVVGQSSGEFMGYLNEVQQDFFGIFNGANPSAWNPQDLYSNALGVSFFEKYHFQLNSNPRSMVHYMQEFLNDSQFRIQQGLYPAKYNYRP